MKHPIYRVTEFAVIGSHTLRIKFDDGTSQIIDFRPVLAGELYGPLADERLFRQARLDPEVHTIVWPNGADFDPAMLHDWPEHLPGLIRLAETWEARTAK